MARIPLNGKSCLVTGATGGIGRAIARKMALEGCNLFLTARDTKALEALQDEIGGGVSGDVEFIATDLANPLGIETLIAAAEAAFEAIDILVNCAGTFPVARLAETAPSTLDQCLGVNLRAPMMLTAALAPKMAGRNWGRVVNIGSSSAYAGFPDTSVYCASKHGLLGFSRAVHEELKDRNVRTYCLSPGSVKTEMGRQVPDQDFETFIEPEDIAEYVAFVVSFDGNLVTEEIRLSRMQVR